MKTNTEYLNLFQVPIQISDLELNIDSLIEFYYEMKQKNEKGVELTNMLLLFPGWVEHKVLMNNEDTDRISISFNTII